MFADKLIKAMFDGAQFDFGGVILETPNIIQNAWWGDPDFGEVNTARDVNVYDLLTKEFPARDPVFDSSDPVRCQFFDFGEFDSSDDATADESFASRDGYCAGLLRLPFPVCFFNWHEPPRSDGVGLMRGLPRGSATREQVGLLAFQPDQIRPPFRSGNIPTVVMALFGRSFGKFYTTPMMGFSVKDGLLSHPTAILDHLEKTADRWEEEGLQQISCRIGQSFEDLQDATTLFLMALLGRLCAEGMQKETIEPPEKINRKRARRGQPEMFKHTRVRLAPYREPLGHSGPRDNFTPRAYHLRRGHVRRFANGQSTWVRHHFVGDPAYGKIEHDYHVDR